MKKYFLLVFFGLLACGASAQSHMVDKLVWLVEPILDYDKIGLFSNGLAKVKKDDKYGFINILGEEVIPCIYDNVGDFSENLAAVEKDGSLGLIDKKGSIVAPFDYQQDWRNPKVLPKFKNNLIVLSKNGRYGALDTTGREIIPFIYYSAFSFSEGFAGVTKDFKYYGFINRKGEEITSFSYSSYRHFHEGMARVKKNGKYGFIDELGKEVIRCDYDEAGQFSEGLAWIKKNNKYGYIDKTGKIVIPLIYDYYAGHFSEGLAWVKKNDKYGYIDKSGKVIIPFMYDNVIIYNPISNFSEGVAKVKKGNKWTYINRDNKIIIPFEYESIKSFSDGLLAIERNGKYGYIDKTGKIVIPFNFFLGEAFHNGLALTSKYGQGYSLINKKGIIVTPILLEDTPFGTSEFIAAQKREGDGKWGILSYNSNKRDNIKDVPARKEIVKDKKIREQDINKEKLALVWLTPNPDENNNQNQTSQELPIKLKAFSTTGNTNLQPEDFKVFINNQRQTTKSGETLLRGTTFNAVVQLQNGKNNIKVCIGENCSKTLTAYYTTAKPNLHLLSIGTNPPDLQYTQNDANDFASIYKSQKQLFANVFIEELVGDGATRTAIIEQLEMLNYQHQEGHIRPNDVVMLFISSHGYIETQDNNRFRIQASDFNPAFYKTRSVAYEEITQTLSNINCKKIIWIDACHSGGAKANAALINRYIQQLNDTYAGITTITSSTQNQKSYEHTNWQNGAFTEALLQGLSGKADGKGTAGSRDGVITLGELYSYISERVPQLVNSINKPTQQPQITRDDLGDLGIFVW